MRWSFLVLNEIHASLFWGVNSRNTEDKKNTPWAPSGYSPGCPRADCRVYSIPSDFIPYLKGSTLSPKHRQTHLLGVRTKWPHVGAPLDALRFSTNGASRRRRRGGFAKSNFVVKHTFRAPSVTLSTSAYSIFNFALDRDGPRAVGACFWWVFCKIPKNIY